MREYELECLECGDSFGSKEIMEEHFDLEHSGKKVRYREVSSSLLPVQISSHINSSALIGFVLGILLTAGGITGASYIQEELDEETQITVVNCEECRYERFKTVTDRMMEAEYKEVDYQSQKGQALIEKYNLSYVPAFIFEKEVQDHGNFTQIRNALIKHEDAYVMSDSTVKKAQRFSEGKNIN